MHIVLYIYGSMRISLFVHRQGCNYASFSLFGVPVRKMAIQCAMSMGCVKGFSIFTAFNWEIMTKLAKQPIYWTSKFKRYNTYTNRASGLKIKCTQKRHCRMILCPSLKAVYLLFDFHSPGFWFVGPAGSLCSSPGHHWHLGSDSGRWPGCQGIS